MSLTEQFLRAAKAQQGEAKSESLHENHKRPLCEAVKAKPTAR